MGVGWNSIIFDDLEWPLARVSRSLYTYKSNISKWCILGTNLLKNTNRKPYTIYRMVPLSMTLSDLWPRFQGHDIFLTLNISETIRGRAIAIIERQYEVICTLSNGDISNDLDGPLTRFSRSRHLWSRISQKCCILGTQLLKNTNRKPYPIYRMVPFSMTLSDFWPAFQGHAIFEVEYGKRRILKTKLLFHTNRKLYLTYGMVLCVAQVCQHQLSFLFIIRRSHLRNRK